MTKVLTELRKSPRQKRAAALLQMLDHIEFAPADPSVANHEAEPAPPCLRTRRLRVEPLGRTGDALQVLAEKVDLLKQILQR